MGQAYAVRGMCARLVAPTALIALLAAPFAVACGRDDEAGVRETLAAFADAAARKDYQRLCDELFSRGLAGEAGRTLPCEVALRTSALDDARRPRIEVLSVTVDGDTATAVVRSRAANQPASDDTVRLVREDGAWRIAALASS
jgi:hypothetical protein